MKNPPEPALPDEGGACLQRGRVAVGEVDHVHDPGLLNGSQHLLAFGVAGGQGFLAEDMQAGLGRGHGDRGVPTVGRHVRDGIEARGLEHLPVILVNPGHAEFRGKSPRAGHVEITAGDKLHTLEVLETTGMLMGHATGADETQSNTLSCHRR